MCPLLVKNEITDKHSHPAITILQFSAWFQVKKNQKEKKKGKEEKKVCLLGKGKKFN